MLVPAKILCDLCGAEIIKGRRYPTVEVPLTKELRAVVEKDIEERRPRGGILDILPMQSLVPQAITIASCGCVLALIPDLREAAERLVKDYVAKAQEAREQAQAQDREEADEAKSWT